MNTNNSRVKPRAALLALLCLSALAFMPAARAGHLDDLLKLYQESAGRPFSAESGKTFWTTKHTPVAGEPARSCADCHSANLNNTGKHIRTGKLIKPMAPTVNPERLTDARKMKKWLLRICKWVLGRECSAQEKGDVLTFIKNFK
jgi:hypothetical protein